MRDAGAGFPLDPEDMSQIRARFWKSIGYLAVGPRVESGEVIMERKADWRSGGGGGRVENPLNLYADTGLQSANAMGSISGQSLQKAILVSQSSDDHALPFQRNDAC
jgi:hypothetical protein